MATTIRHGNDRRECLQCDWTGDVGKLVYDPAGATFCPSCGSEDVGEAEEDRQREATARSVERIAGAYRELGIEDGADAAERHLARMREIQEVGR